MSRKRFAGALDVKAKSVCTEHKIVVRDIATDTKTLKPPKPVPRMCNFKLAEWAGMSAKFQKLGDLADTDTWENLKVKLKKKTWWWMSQLEALVKAKRNAWRKWTAIRNMETRSSYVEAHNHPKTAVKEAMSAAAKKA